MRSYHAGVDHYEVLGVDRDAPTPVIRRRYLALARVHHPDVNDGPDREDAEVVMRAVTAAWAVLGDPERRARYDARLAATEGPPPLRRTPFRPYDDDPVDMPDERFDAIRVGDDLTDETIGSGARPPQLLTILPAALLVVGIGGLSAGLVASFAPLLALGLVALVGSGLAFVAAPVVAVFMSRGSERE